MPTGIGGSGTISYRIYANDLAGGPIDLSAPIATVTATTWTSSPLPLGARASFLVRAYDSTTGLEDRNLDARVDITLDASGNDLSGAPGPPFALSVKPSGVGGLQASWGYLPTPNKPLPTGFKVWVTSGSTVNYAAAPAGTVAFAQSLTRFAFTLTGLTGGATYAVGVRAYNAAATEPNTSQAATLIIAASGPAAVSTISASAVAID